MTAATTVSPAVADFAAQVGLDDEVAVVGGRTRWDTGGALSEGVRLVEAPSGIVDYAPSEMTVRVLLGTPVAELGAELALVGQRCSLPDRGGTVGGAIAVGENHVEVLGRGRVRDDVLQVRYVSAEGEIVVGGGAVVKNVSGFNIPKLMVGSLGTLGLLAEAVLRTNPAPPASTWLTSTDAEPMAVFDALLRPGAILWDGTTTWVLLEGHADDIAAETAVLAGLGGFSEASGRPELPAHRWSMTSAEAAALGADAVTGRFVASIGVGTVHGENPPPAKAVDPASRAISDRMKALFDPAGRLNPGRVPGA